MVTRYQVHSGVPQLYASAYYTGSLLLPERIPTHPNNLLLMAAFWEDVWNGRGRSFSFSFYIFILRASLVAHTGKNLSAMQETWVQSLGREDPLEKGMTMHSSILAWRIPWTEEEPRGI